jgi:hypothetical protein
MIDMLLRDTDRYFALTIGHFHAISGPPSIGLEHAELALRIAAEE